MKNIKKLKSVAVGNITIQNYKTFPSMEWGEDGGLDADICVNKTPVVHIYQEGNGGCALDTVLNEELLPSLKENVLKVLKKHDDGYQKYGWLKNKTAEKVDADDFESFVNVMAQRHDDIKLLESRNKKLMHDTFAFVEDGAMRQTWTFDSKRLPIENAKKQINKPNLVVLSLEELRQPM